MTILLTPLLTAPAQLDAALRGRGHAVLGAAGLRELVHATADELDALRPAWSDLPPDGYLRDGGRYRRRRHACFVVEGDAVQAVPHRAHWQPIEYNALHGGLERWFEPIRDEVIARPVWARLLVALSAHCSALKGAQRWYVEAHQFRIDTTDGIGRPTPEGAHRDGVDLVAVLLIDRTGIKGGETRVFEADGPAGLRFTMTEPWTTLLLDDARVIHESTPIQPLADAGHRDTLVLTWRAGGFQGPPGR
ncbi:MAG TPA: 2OG-Fe dioxygenase family protein [Burkholderiaceae bacterium]|nr:2OG-Fe dioxygenase family protein [Burkholderiaceae bacterium]